MSKYVLKRFGQLVKAIDQTNPTVESHIRQIFDKIMHGIGTCYYEVSFRSPRSGAGDSNSIILNSEWCSVSEQEDKARHLMRGDSSYTDQTAYAYFESKELWISATEPNGLLNICTKAEDLRIAGDDADGIPTYVDPADMGTSKSSILIPLKRNGFTIGVMCLEFPNVVRREGETKQFIHGIAQVVSSYFEKKKNSNRSLSESKEAFSELVEDLNFDSIRLPGDKLDLFLGYSHRADPEVIETIKDTINNHYADNFNLKSWEDINNLGQITTNLCRAIDDSDYALFYLSEPTPERQPTQQPYQDNPNVLFECGIKHGRYSDSEKGASHWLALREHPDLTDTAPFDFAGHNMIHIDRDDNNQMMQPQLETKLVAILGSILNP